MEINNQMLQFKPYFTAEQDPFDSITWEKRTASIKEGNKTIFHQEVEVPSFWSQNATDIVAQHYFKVVNGEKEYSVKQCTSRVSKAFAKAGVRLGYFDKETGKIFEKELRYLLVNQYVCFNSPVWYNLGIEKDGQLAACFLQSVEDTMESLTALQTSETNLFRMGSGTGTNYSPLREEGALLSNGGTASGPVSFMRGPDCWAGVTKSGGKTRRAAKMVMLNVSHPDIEPFIQTKVTVEKMAQDLISRGWPADYNSMTYTYLPYQNANHSVRVTDEFMNAVELDKNFDLVSPKGYVTKTVKAKELFNKIAEAAHKCADPGLQFDTTINEWHTSPNSGRINGSNPCQNSWSTVLTRSGIRTFADISEGDVIWSGKEWTTITKKWCTGYKPVYKYATTIGHFIGTENHNVYSNGVRTEVRQADCIDLCLGPATSVKIDELDSQIIMDGLVIGDGTVRHNKDVLLCVGANDQDYFTSEIASKILRHRPGTDAFNYSIVTTITPSELPKTYERTVPDRYFYGDEKTKCAFLRGLYTANGSVVDKRVTLKQASRKLIDQVQLMLSSLGIHSYITTNKPHDVEFANGTYTCKESYDLNITSGRTIFRDSIGFIQGYKNEKVQPGGPLRTKTSSIKSVDYLGIHEVFDITVDCADHTYWTGGHLVSNCSEYMFVDDSACNLASHNLRKYYVNNTFDCVAYEKATRLTITAMDIAVSISSYPTKKIEENSHKLRPLGIGWANGGALLMCMGLPYDSDKGRFWLASITSLLNAVAYNQSTAIAKALGPCEDFAKNKVDFLKVIRKHADANYQLRHLAIEADIKDLSIVAAAEEFWRDNELLGLQYGFRNSQATVLAPTGTIGFMMDCDTTGIEPDIAVVKHKKMAGGGWMKIVNQSVRPALVNLGYSETEIELIESHILKYETMLGAPNLKREHLPIFDCAVGIRFIKPSGHLKMMAACQPFLSGAISKTVNLPSSASVADIEDAYMQAWKLKLKAVAVYRDNCKSSQPLNVKDYTEETDQKCGFCDGKVQRAGSCLVCVVCGTPSSCS
jgi:ribonucleoside-diphosphate reductase alpha chain